MSNSKRHISAKHAPNSLSKPSLKSLFLLLSFYVEIILVSSFLMGISRAYAELIYRCFGSRIWARLEYSGQRLIPALCRKQRVFLISCGWKIYFWSTVSDYFTRWEQLKEKLQLEDLHSHYRHLVFERHPLYCAGSNVRNFWRCVKVTDSDDRKFRAVFVF